MVWTMCSIENLQAKVLSRVVVVFTRPNVFMYKPFCKVIQLTKTYSHFKNIRGVFANEIVAFFQILLVYIPEVMKNLTFCVTFHNFSSLILACLLCCSRLISLFFSVAFWLGICVEVDVDMITPTPPCSYVFALTHNCLFNTSDSYSKSVHA